MRRRRRSEIEKTTTLIANLKFNSQANGEMSLPSGGEQTEAEKENLEKILPPFKYRSKFNRFEETKV